MTTALVMACAIFAGGCGTTAGQADTQQMDTQQMDTQQMDTQQSETKTPDMQQNGAQQNETEQEDAGQMDTQKADAVEYEYTIEELMCQRNFEAGLCGYRADVSDGREPGRFGRFPVCVGNF